MFDLAAGAVGIVGIVGAVSIVGAVGAVGAARGRKLGGVGTAATAAKCSEFGVVVGASMAPTEADNGSGGGQYTGGRPPRNHWPRHDKVLANGAVNRSVSEGGGAARGGENAVTMPVAETRATESPVAWGCATASV